MTWRDYDIVGSFNNQRYTNIDAERTINLFEYIDPLGKKPKSLIPTSGLINEEVTFPSVGSGGFRAQFTYKDNSNPNVPVMLMIIGNTLYRIGTSVEGQSATPYTPTINGTVGYVGVDANTFLVIFVDGINGWIYDKDINNFVKITDPSFPTRPVDVTYLDGFFVVANGNTNTFQLSSFNNGLIWGGVGAGATATFAAGVTGNVTIAGTASNLNFQVGTPVVFSGGGLPAEITAGTTYYVVFQDSPGTAIIRVSATKGGAIITYAAGGNGTITNNGQLQLGSITSHPGNIVACRTLHRRLFLFSENYTEVWENAGLGTNLPFRRNNSLLIEFGTPSVASIEVGFDLMFFLSQDQDGQSSVQMVAGAQAIPVSTRALDYLFAQYATNNQVSDAAGILIKENGLIFYRLNFTAANVTYVYNVMMSSEGEQNKKWHEEQTLNGNRHPAQTHAYFNGNNYYGDYLTHILYRVDPNTMTNDGENIPRIRIGQSKTSTEYKRLRIDRFHLDLIQGQDTTEQIFFEFTTDIVSKPDILTLATTADLVTGLRVQVSTSAGTLPEPLAPFTYYYVIVLSNFDIKLATTYANALSNTAIILTTDAVGLNFVEYPLNSNLVPEVFLSYSKDGGVSYGNRLIGTMGRTGDRTYRTVWRKLGTVPRGQGFVPKIEFFNEIPFVVLGAAWVFEEMPE
jgi:hypothetical protein